MRLIVSILFCCLIFSASAQRKEGFSRSSHEKEALVLLNNFVKALQIPKEGASKRACKPYMVDDELKITKIAFEKAHRHAIHFKYPVHITEVKRVNPENKEGIEYKVWIGKNVGMGVSPVSVHIFFPKAGGLPKVCNINNL